MTKNLKTQLEEIIDESITIVNVKAKINGTQKKNYFLFSFPDCIGKIIEDLSV